MIDNNDYELQTFVPGGILGLSQLWTKVRAENHSRIAPEKANKIEFMKTSLFNLKKIKIDFKYVKIPSILQYV